MVPLSHSLHGVWNVSLCGISQVLFSPLIPLALFLVLYLCEPMNGETSSPFCFARRTGLIYTCGFALTSIFVVFLFIPAFYGGVVRQKMMAESDLSTFPGFGLSYEEVANAAMCVAERLKADPGLLLMTSIFESLFFAVRAWTKSDSQDPALRCACGLVCFPNRFGFLLLPSMTDTESLIIFQTVDAFWSNHPGSVPE